MKRKVAIDMRILTVALAVGVALGATLLYVVPAIVWIPLLSVALSVAWIATSPRLSAAAIIVATMLLGVTRAAQSMDGVALELLSSDNICIQELPDVPLASRLGSVAGQFRNRLETIFEDNGIGGDSYAIAVAMTLGDKAYINKDLRNTFSIAGASHVLALSGMHIGILYAILLFFMARIPEYLLLLPRHIGETYAGMCVERHSILTPKEQRRVRFLMRGISVITMRRIGICSATITIWAYALLVGMAPSVVRAALMLTIVSACFLLMRKTLPIDSLVLAAFVVLLVSPLSLFDVGFQLSYLSVLGIALFFKPFCNIGWWIVSLGNPVRLYCMTHSVKLGKPRHHRKRISVPLILLQAVSLTLSAQLLVTPLVAYYFHRIPCYSILTSLIVAVSAVIIVWLGVALLVVGTISRNPLTELLAWLLDKTIQTQDVILEWIAALPCSSIEGITISFPQLVLVYLIVAIVIYIARFILPTSFFDQK